MKWSITHTHTHTSISLVDTPPPSNIHCWPASWPVIAVLHHAFQTIAGANGTLLAQLRPCRRAAREISPLQADIGAQHSRCRRPCSSTCRFLIRCPTASKWGINITIILPCGCWYKAHHLSASRRGRVQGHHRTSPEPFLEINRDVYRVFRLLRGAMGRRRYPLLREPGL